MKITKHQNTSVLPILQSGQGFTWTPEGLKTEELATWDSVSPEIKQLTQDINNKEYEEHRRNNDVRFTGEKPLESEDHYFGGAIAGINGLGAAKTAADIINNPALAKTTAGALLGTAIASGEVLSDLDYYKNILEGETQIKMQDVLLGALPLTAATRRSKKWSQDFSVPHWLRDERLANHATIIGGDRFDIVKHSKRKTYKPRGYILTRDVERAREILDEYTRVIKSEGVGSPKLKSLSEEYTQLYAIRPYLIHFLNDGGQLSKLKQVETLPLYLKHFNYEKR